MAKKTKKKTTRRPPRRSRPKPKPEEPTVANNLEQEPPTTAELIGAVKLGLERTSDDLAVQFEVAVKVRDRAKMDLEEAERIYRDAKEAHYQSDAAVQRLSKLRELVKVV